ncbi:MAG: hypothetical protein QOK48_2389 [Blastocatellia bacterium]|nr:hypothetical protein [Blastocatellia bacterium]
MPTWRAWRHVQPRDILLLMTGAAFLTVLAMAGDAALHVLRMNMIVVTLPRVVSGRMTIQTARMLEHGND